MKKSKDRIQNLEGEIDKLNEQLKAMDGDKATLHKQATEKVRSLEAQVKTLRQEKDEIEVFE